jgi:molybdopterin/thiamine biosynthesis adenylyltransferase
MLGRLDRVVRAISVVCPRNAPAHPRIVPFAQGTTLLDALKAGANAVGIESIPIDFEGRRGGAHLVLGPGAPSGGAIQVHGEGWSGGFSRDEMVGGSLESALPIGPYLAAALAVGEVFKAVRQGGGPHSPGAFYSAWSHQAGPSAPLPQGPSSLPDIRLAETLAGVGAVGCICAHTFWSTAELSGDVLLVDGDPKGIDITNLNRYLLFGPSHVNRPKASTARDLLQGGDISWTPLDRALEEAPRPQRRLICAVDSNASRLGVQMCWPESLIMASTHEMRAEVVRCDPREGGPCAHCFNHHEEETPDDELRRRFRVASAQEQERLARENRASLQEAKEWAERGTCGTTGERVRDGMRRSSRMIRFAVPFVSLAAGAMLAAEVIKEYIDAPVPLSPLTPRAALQFLRPQLSTGAKPYARDPSCPTCRPETSAVAVWRSRMAAAPLRGDGGQPG